jgi:hypothetical protein
VDDLSEEHVEYSQLRDEFKGNTVNADLFSAIIGKSIDLVEYSLGARQISVKVSDPEPRRTPRKH